MSRRLLPRALSLLLLAFLLVPSSIATSQTTSLQGILESLETQVLNLEKHLKETTELSAQQQAELESIRRQSQSLTMRLNDSVTLQKQVSELQTRVVGLLSELEMLETDYSQLQNQFETVSNSLEKAEESSTHIARHSRLTGPILGFVAGVLIGGGVTILILSNIDRVDISDLFED